MGLFSLLFAGSGLGLLDALAGNPGLAIDAVGIVVATAVPLIVLVATLTFERKRHEASLALEREKMRIEQVQNQEALRVQQEHHLETQRIQMEEIRVSKMPHLRLSLSRGEEGRMWELDGSGYHSVISFENCGNGAAFGVHPKIVGPGFELHQSMRPKGLPTLDLVQRDYMYDSIIAVGEIGEVEVGLLHHDGKGRLVRKLEESIGDRATITVCFRDSLFNDYEQSYTVTIDAKANHFNIMNQGLPKLVKRRDLRAEF